VPATGCQQSQSSSKSEELESTYAVRREKKKLNPVLTVNVSAFNK